jgi:small subunit ribosomal protein S9
MVSTASSYIWGLGRRKTSVARVRIAPGSGQVLVNGRPVEQFFPVERRLKEALAPLQIGDAKARYNVLINVQGGGETGQSGAVMLGIARALAKAEPQLHVELRTKGYLTRDSRMVERKKYGLHGARRGCQFSKR